MIKYFRKIGEEELVKLERFINSPYFNRNKNVIRLFQYLKSKHPVLSDDDVSNENIFFNVFDSNEIDEMKLRKLISDYSIVFENFLTQLELEEIPDHNNVLLLKSLRKRGLMRRYKLKLNELSHLNNKSFSKNGTYYDDQVNFYDELFQSNFNTYKTQFADCLQDKSDSIDYRFIFSKLHNFNEMFSNEIGRRKRFKKNFYSEVMSFIEQNKDTIKSSHPNIYVIYLVLLMQFTLDDKYLRVLIKFISTHERKFEAVTLEHFYHYIRSYYVQKINAGQTNYRKNLIKLFKEMDKKNLFVIDGTITDVEFNSVVNNCLPEKEYEWLEFFIGKYVKYLDASGKGAYNIARAKLLFEQKDYKKAFQHLSEVEFKEPNYYYNSKFILARMYYETGNISGIKYLLDNLRQYIRVKKNLTSTELDTIKVFNKYISQLIKLNESQSQNKKSLTVILRKEIENEKKVVPSKNWFLAQLRA